MYAYDTETTGSDLWHGCLPFFFAFCHDSGKLEWYEFLVDPYTRLPLYNQDEIDRVCETLCSDEGVIHNVNFDTRATDAAIEHLIEIDGYSTPSSLLRSLLDRHQPPVTPLLTQMQDNTRKIKQGTRRPDYAIDWLWDGIEDSLIASHALRNLWPHSLKKLRAVFLHISVWKQNNLRIATNTARRIVRTNAFIEKYGNWRIADARDPHWPAIKRAPKEKTEDVSGWWYYDTWLPLAIATFAPEFLPEENSNVAKGSQSAQRNRPEDVDSRGQTRSRGNHASRHQKSLITDSGLHETTSTHSWFTVLRDYGLEDVESTLGIWWVIEDALKQEGLYDQYIKRKAILPVAYQMERTGVHVLPTIESEVERYKTKGDEHEQQASNIIVDELKKKVEPLDSRLLPEIEKPNLGSFQQLSEILYGHYELRPPKKTPEGNASTDAEVLKKLRDTIAEDHSAAKFINHLLLSRTNYKAYDYGLSYYRWVVQNAIHSSLNITGTKFTRQSSSNPNLQNVTNGKENEEGEIDYNLRACFGPPFGYHWLTYDYSNIELRIWGYDCGNREFISCFENDVSVHYIIACELHPELRKLDPNSEECKKNLWYKKTKNGNFSVIYGASPRKADLTYGVPGATEHIGKRFPEVKKYTSFLHSQVMKVGYINTLGGYRLYIPKSEPHKAVSGRVQGSAGEVIGNAMVDCGDSFSRNPHWNTEIIMQIHDELNFQTPADSSYKEDIYRSIFHNMTKQGDKIGIPLSVGAGLIKDNWFTSEDIVL